MGQVLWHPARLMADAPSRFHAVLLLALLLAALACRADMPPAAGAGRFEHGLLWRIDRPGLAPSYLFGTIHADDERVLALSAPARRAFARSRRFAFEMINDETASRRFRAAMVTREPSLAAVLGADDFARVEVLLGERGIAREARGRFKPWAALLVLAQPPAGAGIILDQLLLIDAERAGKPLTALETVDEQIAAFDTMAEPVQVALLRHVLTRQDEIVEAARMLTAAYLDADLGAMWRANQAAMGDDPALAAEQEIFIERLLFARNRRFADHLVPLLAGGGVFAAFGALHLHGENGVPALLRQCGWRVTPLR